MSAMKTVLAIDKHFTQLAFIKTSTTQLGCLHTITYTHTHTRQHAIKQIVLPFFRGV